MTKDKYEGEDRRKKRRNKDNGWRSWMADWGLIAVAVSGGIWLGTLQATQVWAGEQRVEIKKELIEVRKLLRKQATYNGAVTNALKVQATASDQGGGRVLADAERVMIMAALEQQGQNRTKAAEALGISRRTLHRKLNRYQLEDETTT